MGFLREVHQFEINREGHGHVASLGDGEIFDRGGQFAFRPHIATAAALGQEAQAFLQIKDRLSLQPDDHFAENPAQLADFGGKRVSLGLGR